MTAAKFCEYSKTQLIAHFKWMSSLICELYLSKAGREEGGRGRKEGEKEKRKGGRVGSIKKGNMVRLEK